MPVKMKNKNVMQQPLLGSQVGAKGPLSGGRYFLPSPEAVAADAATTMDERPDLFISAGMGWESGAQRRAMANLCLIKGVYLRCMDAPEKLGPLTRLRLVLHDLWRKNDLVKLSLALDSLQVKLHSANDIAALLVGHFPLIATDHQTVAGEPLRMEDRVTIEMLGILCFMHFSAMQPGPSSMAEFTVKGDSGFLASTALTADPVHFQFSGDVDWKSLREATQSQSKPVMEGRMHAKWLCHDMLLPMMFMLVKCLESGAPRDMAESWAQTMFSDLLSNVGVIVKVRIADSISLQNKMLSLFTTASTTLLGWMLHLWSMRSQQQ